ncbi:uncharacterized protein LOC114244836 [Bombyx mandarina]|uniref:Uncharacterized protein LOC114244836 n=1 Tax=Bombyx mandarina TaxID=7092 RepID=A0A6J2JRY8_BOMMA|nr:uncharacterized protein LOC114244836 [Bombyx mandarina]
MSTPHAQRILCILGFFIVLCSATVPEPQTVHQHEVETKKVELFEGVSVKIPLGKNTSSVMSLEIETDKGDQEGRGKKQKLMQKILPLFIMPFVLQSAIVPLFLSMLKFMLFKSLMVGKLALFLILINAFKNHNSVKGRDSEIANVHYGYHDSGMEYGAYIN